MKERKPLKNLLSLQLEKMAVLATKIFHFLYIILGASIGLVHCGTISHHLFLQVLRPHDSSVEDSINTQNQCPFVCTVENQCGFWPPLLPR